MDIPAVAADPQAREIGQRLFLNYCAQCHASDARGGNGFPNLTDNDWLYGGDPEAIIATHHQRARSGMMPPWPQLGDEAIKDVANYVLSLSGRTHDALRAAHGKEMFTTNCVACHGADGKGNPALGAPNLTDDIWLYGGGEAADHRDHHQGPQRRDAGVGRVPRPDKVHLLAAYVYGLSHPQK